jgi:hypothetical protein
MTVSQNAAGKRKIWPFIALAGALGGIGATVYYWDAISNLFNQPPKVDFDLRTPTRTLFYIAPTGFTKYFPNDGDQIIWRNKSTDDKTPPDKLKYNWYVQYNSTGDWYAINYTGHTLGRFPASNDVGHTFRLIATDEGGKQDSKTLVMPFDPARSPQYPERKLGIPRGVNYNVGISLWRNIYRSPEDEEMKEDLTVTHNELKCEVIRIFGDNEEKMLKCGEMAFEVGFKKVLLNPMYIELPINQTAKRIIDFAKKTQIASEKINRYFILVIDNEASVNSKGIYDSPTRNQRIAEVSQHKGQSEYRIRLNNYLRQVASETKQIYKGDISYAAGSWEEVDWANIPFDVISINHYFDGIHTDGYLKKIGDLQKVKKVIITEFGCAAYEISPL